MFFGRNRNDHNNINIGNRTRNLNQDQQYNIPPIQPEWKRNWANLKLKLLVALRDFVVYFKTWSLLVKIVFIFGILVTITFIFTPNPSKVPAVVELNAMEKLRNDISNDAIQDEYIPEKVKYFCNKSDGIEYKYTLIQDEIISINPNGNCD